MGQHISPLLFEGEHLVRMIDRDGEPWFVLTDVCRALEIGNAAMAAKRLDEDEKGISTADTLGGGQEVLIVSEAGIYRLVFSSRKPIAERFKRWLAHEVIPTIRKTGRYDPQQAAVDAPAVEKRLFPEWPLEELRTKRGVVDMYRLLYGCMAAQWIGPQLGFPTPPIELVENGRQYSLMLTISPGAGG